jgi:uncharacterized membrane protein YgcG
MSETCLERWMRQPHFTCPRCDAKSWNPRDLKELYCGRCHIFVAPPITLREAAHERRAEEYKGRGITQLTRREDDDSGSSFPTFPTFSSDPAPSTAPDPSPPSFDPGGGSSGGGGASGDW